MPAPWVKSSHFARMRRKFSYTSVDFGDLGSGFAFKAKCFQVIPALRVDLAIPRYITKESVVRVAILGAGNCLVQRTLCIKRFIPIINPLHETLT